MEQNMVTWFEIPVSDMKRATDFYEKVFDIAISVQDFGGLQMGWFPHKGGAAGAMGCLIKNDSYIPSEEGALLYFYSSDIETELKRIEAAGGIIRQSKTMISPEYGHMAVFIDTEGNRVALHSKQ